MGNFGGFSQRESSEISHSSKHAIKINFLIFYDLSKEFSKLFFHKTKNSFENLVKRPSFNPVFSSCHLRIKCFKGNPFEEEKYKKSKGYRK
jgi:hypothetical protein